jgi:KUP system potassium uptake protein
MKEQTDNHGLHKLSTTTLVIAALGVVFGDIGTSQIYTLKECFSPHSLHHIDPTHAHLLGVVSLVLWSLLLLVCVKYLIFILRADNKGEGGVLSLMALASHGMSETSKRRVVIVLLGLFGAALLFGDGIITPAISVLSAVEGLKDGGVLGAAPVDALEAETWNHHMQWLIMGITIVILIVLFSVQFFGTAKVGRFFGPITGLWFVSLGALGVSQLIRGPEILAAFNPWYGWHFLTTGGHAGFVILGSVFLAVTGGEALYADMGHFGRKTIQRGWLFVAFPGLTLNYFGQGALLLRNPAAIEKSPFYLLAPSWMLLPLVILATCATVIASQAVISGAFSITRQAVQLGYLPRLEVRHTSSDEIGQIYVPLVNWILLLATIALVLTFRTSSNLAGAYGIAVSMTMVITTTLTFFVARQVWRMNKYLAVGMIGFFTLIDLAFFSANLMKLFHGGYVPLIIGGVIFVFMATWKKGRYLLGERLKSALMPPERFLKEVVPTFPNRLPGTAIFMARSTNLIPPRSFIT